MTKSINSVILELQRNKKFMGTCPTCDEDFRLADATLFALDGQPPQAALKAIQTVREQIRERKADLAKDRERMTERAQRTAQAVNLGKIIEKIVPSFASFSYLPGDCRALFEPIDYLIFSGLSTVAQVDAIVFVALRGKKWVNGWQHVEVGQVSQGLF